MTAKQPPPVERLEHGLALADALLAQVRPLPPLSGAAHARIKRRLAASSRRGSFRRLGVLRPAVIVSISLVCGGAFGVALDRVVLRPAASVAPPPSNGGHDSGRSRARSGRTSAKTPSPAAPEASAASDAVTAERTPSKEEAPPATSGETVAKPVTPPLARASNPSRKLAFHLPSSDTSLGQSASGVQDLAPVAPSYLPAERPAPATPTMPAAPMPLGTQTVQAPAPSTFTLPVPTAAPPPNDSATTGPASDALSEDRLLAAAVRALRAKTNPRSALAALDEYKAHYPHGRLFVEAEVLRVDALAALNDMPAVLRILDGLDFAQMPGGLTRQLQRGELRATAGRDQEAEADFASVLLRARNQNPDVLERALWGRAQSRASRGDADGARLDANEYLRRFPGGRFAAAASRMASATAP